MNSDELKLLYNELLAHSNTSIHQKVLEILLLDLIERTELDEHYMRKTLEYGGIK